MIVGYRKHKISSAQSIGPDSFKVLGNLARSFFTADQRQKGVVDGIGSPNGCVWNCRQTFLRFFLTAVGEFFWAGVAQTDGSGIADQNFVEFFLQQIESRREFLRASVGQRDGSGIAKKQSPEFF